MSEYKSVESLLSFGIDSISRGLRKHYGKGVTLSSIDNSLSWKEDTLEIDYSPISLSVYWGNDSSKALRIFFGKDLDGLFMLLDYSKLYGYKSTQYYYLQRKESNLKPGTYRYYIIDPYAIKPGTLCTRLYYLPRVEEFVTKSILKSWGILYSQQRKGKADRYYFNYKKPPEGDKLKYRKSHYKGKITPFWRRYEELVERENYRGLAFLVAVGSGVGIYSPDVIAEVREEYHRVTGNYPQSIFGGRIKR